MKNKVIIGFFPITGDPIHYGHLNGAMKVRNMFNLDVVFIQVCGDLINHKPHKTSKYHRHEMTKLALKEFYPYLQYTSLGYDNILVGESVFIEFINTVNFNNVNKFYYIVGSDNEELVLNRFAENKNQITKPYEIVFLARTGSQIISNSKTVVYSEDFSSSLFRTYKNQKMVPKIVLEYCIENKLYGF